MKDKAYHRNWERSHRVTTSNNKKIYGNKRPYPKDGHCELCFEKPIIHAYRQHGRSTRLVYHHWDDSDLSKGLWICPSCHSKITLYDQTRGRVNH